MERAEKSTVIGTDLARKSSYGSEVRLANDGEIRTTQVEMDA